MQIHELDTYSGSLGANAFTAIDNGEDTGKIAIPDLLADVRESIAEANTRIDNIIGGEAPSAEEITDARLGADGIVYSSLGNAIRTQIGDLQSVIGTDYTLVDGYLGVDGAIISAGATTKEKTTSMFPVYPGQTISLRIQFSTTVATWLAFGLYDENGNFISRTGDTAEASSDRTWTYAIPSGVRFIRASYRSYGLVTGFDFSYNNSIIERVNDINEQIKSVDSMSSQIKNLNEIVGNEITLTDGYINSTDGSIIAATQTYKEKTTNLIPISTGQEINISVVFAQTVASWGAFGLYDSEGAFISRTNDNPVATDNRTWSYTAGANVHFVRFSFRSFDQVNNISFNFANSVLERLAANEWNISGAGHRAVMFDRIMNRQGEGYGYPDNSIKGVTAAADDGFKKIRVSIASTSDDVIYCTHSYELQHNSEYSTPLLTLDGDPYYQNVDINSVTSDFIDRLTYKGEPIPKLDSMLETLAAYEIELTLEMKDVFSATQAQQLIDTINYYRVPIVVSGLPTNNQLYAVTNLVNYLDIAAIINYSDAELENRAAALEGKYKTLRFDAFYTDVISKESITNYIHPNYKIKLGGSNPTKAELESANVWADVCETNLTYSEII